MRYKKYPEYNQSFFGKTEVGEIAWKYRDKHPTVFIKYKGVGHTADDPCMEASFSPVSHDERGETSLMMSGVSFLRSTGLLRYILYGLNTTVQNRTNV